MTFTYQDVLDAARKVVAEKGADYVYPRNMGGAGYGQGVPKGKGPVYAEGEIPSCLVGHVIYALDPEAFANLAAVEAELGTVSAEDLTLGVCYDAEEDDEYGYLPSDFWDVEAEALMNTAQNYQDRGKPWGDSLALAEDGG